MADLFKFSGSRPANYDKYLGPFIFEPYGKDMANRIPAKGVESVLEIASGTGRVTRHLRKTLSDSVRLIASDLNPDMLNVAREKLSDLKNIEFQIADAQELPFDSNSFDVVVCQFGLMFLPDKQKGFDEIFRVLKPGGMFLFYTWEKTDRVGIFNLVFEEHVVPFFHPEDPTRFRIPFSLYDPDQLKGYMRNSDFENISVDRIVLNGVTDKARDIVDGFFITHAIGQEVKDRDPDAYKAIAQQMEEEIIKRYSEKPVVCELAAFLGSGTKKKG